ncbi:MAG: tetratricopeptide repeat protein [Ignavibacteria bacterium]
MRVFTIILYILTVSFLAFSQPKTTEVLQGINYIYHLKFDSAAIIFDKQIKSYPDDPTGYYFSAMIEFWKINLNKSDISYDEVFFNKVEKVIEVADRMLEQNENDFYALLYKGGAIGYRGLLRSVRESWLKAAEDGKVALNLLSRATSLNSRNKDALFGIGVYNYFAEYVPEKYPLLKPLLIIFPSGNKSLGLQQIKETSHQGIYAKTEATYILAFLYLFYEKNYVEAEYYSKILYEQFPENPVFEKYYFTSLVGQSRFGEALDGWKKVYEKTNQSVTGYTSPYLKREATFYISLCLVRLLRILEVEEYINTCINLSEELEKEDTSFKVWAYLYRAMMYDVKGDRKRAIEDYNRVLSMEDFQNSHQEAQRYIKNPYVQ